MSITPSQIAASIAQTAYQQSQVARAADADHSNRSRESARLRRLHEQSLESVEDPVETTDEHLTIRDEQSGNSGQQPSHEDSSKQPDNGTGGSIDLTA